jgi:hypothetical protein
MSPPDLLCRWCNLPQLMLHLTNGKIAGVLVLHQVTMYLLLSGVFNSLMFSEYPESLLKAIQNETSVLSNIILCAMIYKCI